MTNVSKSGFIADLEDFIKSKKEEFEEARDEHFMQFSEDYENEESEFYEISKEEIDGFNEKYLQALQFIELLEKFLNKH